MATLPLTSDGQKGAVAVRGREYIVPSVEEGWAVALRGGYVVAMIVIANDRGSTTIAVMFVLKNQLLKLTGLC